MTSPPEDIRNSLGRNLTYGMLDRIGRKIVVGEFENRAFPTEAELSKEYAVSRSVTREAVKMLTAKGLLSARPRLGTSVQPPATWNLFDPDVLRWLLERRFSVDLLRQFSELRLAIEPMAARLAAETANAAAVDGIQRGYGRMEAADRGEEDPLDADIAFHVAVLRAAGNPFFGQFEEVVATALRTSIRFTNRRQGRSASLPAHKAVLAAITRKNPAGAQKAMAAIIQDVLGLIEGAEA